MKPSNDDPGRLLGRLAENIDGILDDEMSNALQSLVGVGPASAGDFADRDMPLLLGRAFADSLTGRLRAFDGAVEKSIYFEAGLPVMAASTDASDRMLAMLLREGAIDTRQNDETVRVVDATGRKVGAVLVDLGFLRSDELLPAVRRHYESIIVSLFSWSTGGWQIEPNVTAGPDRTRLLRHPALLVREGLERGYPTDRIRSRLATHGNALLLDNSASAADIVTLVAPDRAQTRLVTLFDGVRSVEDVARAVSLPEDVVLRIAFALFCFGVLQPVVAAMSEQTTSRVGVRDIQIERERVHSRYALAMESDYFTFLGVDRLADTAEIGRAYTRLQKEIAPEALGPELWHELKLQIETVQQVLDEALRILCSKTLRSSYEFNLAHGPDAESTTDEGGESGATPPPTLL